MTAPTKIEREHYAKLVGRQITAILWEDMEGEAQPVLLLPAGIGTEMPQPPRCSPTLRATARDIWITICDSALIDPTLRR